MENKKLEVVWVDISRLRPHEKNPRTIQRHLRDKLKESIQKFGLVDPLVVNMYPGREYVIVGGNQRYQLLKELGYTTVPVVQVYLPPEKEEELLLRLNKNVGVWDFDRLVDEFSFDALVDVGFLDAEIRILEGVKKITTKKKRFTVIVDTIDEQDFLATFGDIKKIKYAQLIRILREKFLGEQPKEVECHESNSV